MITLKLREFFDWLELTTLTPTQKRLELCWKAATDAIDDRPKQLSLYAQYYRMKANYTALQQNLPDLPYADRERIVREVEFYQTMSDFYRKEMRIACQKYPSFS